METVAKCHFKILGVPNQGEFQGSTKNWNRRLADTKCWNTDLCETQVM